MKAGWLSEPAFAVPPDADSGIAGTGAPLHVLVGFLDQSPGYSAHLVPPRLLVGREGWSPTASR